MLAAGRRLYVYYRVAPAELAPVVAAVQQMQAGLCACHQGLQAQLLRRADEVAAGEAADAADAAAGDRLHAPAVTLMECYAAPQGVDDTLLVEIERAAAALPHTGRAGERHHELFEPCG